MKICELLGKILKLNNKLISIQLIGPLEIKSIYLAQIDYAHCQRNKAARITLYCMTAKLVLGYTLLIN